VLRFWAQDEEGNQLFSDSREYGFNFVDNAGFEPAMVDNVAGRGYDTVIEADKVTEERFTVPLDDTKGAIELHATLTYIFFVTPPPEAKDRMQQGIIARIQQGTPEERDRILNEEVPGRMASMNTLETTYPPVIMAKADAILALQ
jgi:hypothetical protein